jgi:hypothetical protein
MASIGFGVASFAACSVGDLPVVQPNGDGSSGAASDAAGGGSGGTGFDAVKDQSTGGGPGADGSHDARPDVCTIAAPAPCYEGPPGTEGVGRCRAGTLTCNDATLECSGQILPAGADCKLDTVDEDCDGRTVGHVWSRRFGDSALQRLSDATVDGVGNTFLTGYSWGSVPLNSQTTLPSGMYLIKLDREGNVLWGKGWEPALVGNSLAALDTGHIAVAGLVARTTDFGGGPLVPPRDGYPAPFLALFDAQGTHVWSTLVPAELKLTSLGNRFWVAGRFSGTVSWPGGREFTATSSSDLLVGLLETDRTVVWMRNLPGPAGVHRATRDTSGNVFVAGDIEAFADFGGGQIGNGVLSSFVLKLDASGNHVFSHAFGHIARYVRLVGMAVASEGSIWVVAPFSGAFALQNQSFVSRGEDDIYAVNLDASGKLLASAQFGDTGKDLSWDCAIDHEGHLIIAGASTGKIDVGACSVAPNGGFYDAFLLGLDKSARPFFLHSFGDAVDSGWEAYPDDAFVEIDIDDRGMIVASGVFDGTVDFGGGPLSAAPASEPNLPSNDLVVAKYGP